MNDTTNTAAIDQMVMASIAPIGSNNTPDMRVGRDGTVTQIAPAASPGVVKDTVGLDLGGAVSGIDAEIARIEGELAEQRFDVKTGAPTLVREGKDRSDRETQLSSLRAARDYQLARNADLQAQRDAAASAKGTADREMAARHAFSQGNPDRAEALARAIADEEAREAARVIVAARRGG